MGVMGVLLLLMVIYSNLGVAIVCTNGLKMDVLNILIFSEQFANSNWYNDLPV